MKMHGAPADPAAVRPAIEADCTMIHSIHAAAARGLPASAAGSAGVEEFLKSRNPTAYADDMQRESFVVAERAGEVPECKADVGGSEGPCEGGAGLGCRGAER